MFPRHSALSFGDLLACFEMPVAQRALRMDGWLSAFPFCRLSFKNPVLLRLPSHSHPHLITRRRPCFCRIWNDNYFLLLCLRIMGNVPATSRLEERKYKVKERKNACRPEGFSFLQPSCDSPPAILNEKRKSWKVC